MGFTCDDISIMRAFEVHLNGKKLCVAGLEEGSVLFSWAAPRISKEEARLVLE